MSYSLTNFSIFGKVACVGAQTMIGIPASFAYSNLRRMSWSSSLEKETLPPPSMMNPASSRFLSRGFDLIWRGIERQMKFFDVDVGDEHAPEHRDGLLAREFAQGIGGDAQLEIVRVWSGGGKAGAGSGQRACGCREKTATR